jgi:endonuclease/exonuclease/phosphatase family metal-dependent hydrolase
MILFRRLSVFCLCVAGLSFLALQSDGQEKKTAVYGTIRLGSWNIEHLGDPKARRGPGEGFEQKPEDLLRYIRHARVDMLAMQEVNADSPGPEGFPMRYRTNSVIAKTLTELNKTPGNAWKHVLFPKMRAGDPGQWTGLAWNTKKVSSVGDIFQVPVSHARSKKGSNLWDRNVHAMMFTAGRDKTDFLVMVMHLKANTTGDFAEHREEEIKELLTHLPRLDKVFPKERDLVFLGDTNILAAKEPAVGAFEKAGFKDLNRADMDTHTSRGVQPFDRVFVPRDQPEFRKSEQKVLSDFQENERLSFFEFRKRFSDHYIVVTEIQIMDDDD